MSLRISMVVICDGCGKEIVRADDVKITNVTHQWSTWRHAFVLERGRVESRPKFMVVERYRRASRTFCLPCADGQPIALASAGVKK